MPTRFASSSVRLLSLSALVTAGSLVSLALGYGREVLIAHQYGAGPTTDAFFIAFFTPQIIYQILITGPLVWALTPFLMRVGVDEGESESNLLAGRILSVTAILLSSLVATWALFARPFADVAAPFMSDGGQRLTADFTRIMAPQVLTYGVGALFVAVLYARGHIFIPVLAQIVNNALVLAIAFFLGPMLGLRAVAVALLLSSVVFLLVLVAGTATTGGIILPRKPLLGRHRRALVVAVIPLVAISVLTQAPGIWERALATLLPEGDLTSISYGYRLLQLAQTFVAAVAAVSFVGLSSSVVRGRRSLFDAQLGWTIRLNLRFSILAAGGLAALAPLVVALAYGGGALTRGSEGVIVATTQLAVLGLPLIGVSVAVQQSLYATSRWRLLALVTAIGVSVHFLAAGLLIPLVGTKGFVAANLAAQLALCCGYLMLVSRGAGLVDRGLALVAGRSVLAAASGAAALWAMGVTGWESQSRPWVLGAIVVAAVLYALVALGFLLATGDRAVRALVNTFMVRRWALPQVGYGFAPVVFAVSVTTGWIVWRAPLLLLIPVVAALVFLALTRFGFGLVLLVAYLPLDWVIVLALDARGYPEGRIIRAVLLCVVVGGWLAERRKDISLPPSIRLLFIGVVTLSLAELLNPSMPDAATGAVGIYTRLLPMALLLVGATMTRSRRHLELLSTAVLIVLLVTGVVIVAQIVRGDTLVSALGLTYPLFGVGVNGLSVNRFPGPFLGAGLPHFLLIAFAVGVATWHLGGGRKRLLWAIGAGAWVIALFANNQRSLFMFVVIDAPIVLVLGRYGRRLLATPFVLVLLIAPAFWLAGNAFVVRASTLTDNPSEVIVGQHILSPFKDRVLPALDDYPLGRGLGTETPGRRFVVGTPSTQTTPESFVASIVGEIGISGLALYGALFAAIAAMLFKGAVTAADKVARRLNAAMLAITLWVIQLAVSYEPLSYFPFAPFYWLLVGCALGLVASPVRAYGTLKPSPAVAAV
jgi:putative peptidoglycan lipid II flippase